MNNERTRATVTAMWMLAVACIGVMLLGCPKPPPDGGHVGVLECTSDAVKAHWPEALPAVNKCLAAASDGTWFNCLLGLISPAAGITEDVIGCVVRGSAQRYAESAAHNPDDTVSVRAAKRAETFIATRGYKFQ